jgi:hypothetical protein
MFLQIATDDSSLFGWLTVIAYFVAAILCGLTAFRAGRIFRDTYTRQHQLIWGLLSLAMFFLGINKELDLQTWFTATIKEIAWNGGWYEAGRAMQVCFIGGLAFVGLAIGVGMLWYMRHVWRHYWLLGIGVLFIARFVVVRAAGFYGVELPRLSQFTGGVQINWLLEFLGATLIAIAAGFNLWRGRKNLENTNSPV